MYHSALLIELISNDIKILCITSLVPPKHSIGDMIGKLDHSGCTRIDEEGCVCQVLNGTPLGAERSKLNRQLLECGFLRSFVKN